MLKSIKKVWSEWVETPPPPKHLPPAKLPTDLSLKYPNMKVTKFKYNRELTRYEIEITLLGEGSFSTCVSKNEAESVNPSRVYEIMCQQLRYMLNNPQKEHHIFSWEKFRRFK